MKISKLYKVVTEERLSVLLKVLQRQKYAISVHQLAKICDLTFSACQRSLRRLLERGFDLKFITREGEQYVSLVRQAPLSTQSFYRSLGNVKLPAVICADFHIGSKGFSELAFLELVDFIKEKKAKSLVVAGDVFQGKGVYRTEAQDLLYPEIDEQLYLGVDLFKKIPEDVEKHLIIGNHESYFKASYMIGYDVVKQLTSMIPNCTYYGHVVKLTIGGKPNITMLVIHGSGGGSYAVSYRPQKIWDQLTEKPTILVVGHFHQLCIISRPGGRYIILPGTLQRESNYLLSRGITAELGWVYVEKITPEVLKFEILRPRLY